jgi:Ferritin-like domain
MDDAFTLDELDRDGAIRETAEKAGVDTRGSFLKKAALGAGAVAGSGAFLGALPSLASAGTIPAGDIAILNFALTLEYLESAFYAEAKASGALSGETLRFAKIVSNHEFSHVKFLQQVLGSKAVASPKFDFKGTTKDQAKFQATADVLENTGVHAYLGQVANIKSKAVLLGAGRILPVEARHAAWIRDIRFSGGTKTTETPAPAGFEDGFSKTRILAAVKGTGFIVG